MGRIIVKGILIGVGVLVGVCFMVVLGAFILDWIASGNTEEFSRA